MPSWLSIASHSLSDASTSAGVDTAVLSVGMSASILSKLDGCSSKSLNFVHNSDVGDGAGDGVGDGEKLCSLTGGISLLKMLVQLLDLVSLIVGDCCLILACLSGVSEMA